jgi:alpha-amylase
MLLGQQPKIHLAFGLHSHQPYGNLDWVVADAYEKAYAPFLAVLERHPGIKATLHYSGYLLEWLVEHHADLLGRLKKLVAAGQIELLGGAHYEPILAIIPDDNKIEQIVYLKQTLARMLGAVPEGMWLAERVWEPHLVKPIAEAGMAWTCLDDALFRAAGLRGAELFGFYQSEELGH